MNKLKSLFCMLICILMLGSIFVGCKESADKDGVLSITEAKSLVVGALAEDETNQQTLSSTKISKDKSIGNRNIFVKLKKASLMLEGDFDYGQTFFGVVERKKDVWEKYSLQTGECYGYYDGDYAYQKHQDSYKKEFFDDAYFGIMLHSIDCVYVDLLFIEGAWDTIYNDNVEKKYSDKTYTLNMSINMSKYVDFVMAESIKYGLGAEGLFGEGDTLEKNKTDGRANLVVTFAKNNKIIGLNLFIHSYSTVNNFNDTKINVEASSDGVSVPEWFSYSDYE